MGISVIEQGFCKYKHVIAIIVHYPYLQRHIVVFPVFTAQLVPLNNPLHRVNVLEIK